VVFRSDATDLAGAEDPTGEWGQAYVFDAVTQQSELVTVMPDGSPSENLHRTVTISADGRYVAIQSQAFLAGGNGQSGTKIFVRDLEREQTRAASSNQIGVNPGLGGGRPHVVFTTREQLVGEDTDLFLDPYLRRVW
jgi:hypothetical protein